MIKKYNIQDDVRQALLNAASDIFAHYGYNKTTVDEIAKAAGKGKSTFYYYYKSKEEIFRDVIENEAQILKKKLVKSVSDDAEPIKKIKNYIFTRLESFESVVNLYSALKKEARQHFPFLEEIREKYDLEQINIIKKILLEAIENDIIELNDVDLTAESVAMVLGGFEYYLLYSTSEKLMEEEKIDKILSMIFNGILKK